MSPRKSGQQELTREMIMDAARDLFAEKGYQHVSMRQVAKELGYSHGAIYYHFHNKAALFYAMVEEHFSMLNQLLDEIMEKELERRQKLEEVLLGFIQFGLNYQSHYEIMFLIKDEEVQSFLNQGPHKSYEKFAQSVYALCGKTMSIREIWSIFLSLHGFVTHYSRHVTAYEDAEEAARGHVRFLVKLIT
jgi:AcrR family transcriptional regulator